MGSVCGPLFELFEMVGNAAAQFVESLFRLNYLAKAHGDENADSAGHNPQNESRRSFHSTFLP